MQKGVIARLMDRGYGFIKQDGEEKELFFHATELKNASFDEMKDGDAVEFEVVDGDKGPSAVNVSRV